MTDIKKKLKGFEIFVSQENDNRLRNSIMLFLQNQGITDIGGGQKRLVVKDGMNHVYKIAWDLRGVEDNMNEVATSARLKQLVNEGKIPASDLQHFALAEMVDGDPFIIRQELAIRFSEFDQFLRYFNTQDKQRPIAHIMSEYISATDVYREQANRISKILSDYFIAADVTITQEPENYGFNPRSNALYLFDLGSVVPILRDSYGNEVERPTCPKCKQKSLIYIPYIMKANMKHDTLTELNGQYGCANPNCSDTIAGKVLNLDGSVHTATEDHTIVQNYILEHPIEFNIMHLIYCYEWKPQQSWNIKSMMDLRQDIMQFVLGASGQLSDQEMAYIWKNYLTRSAANMLRAMPDINDKTSVVYGNSIKNYVQYAQEVLAIVQGYNMGVTQGPILNSLTAMLYLVKLGDALSNTTIYADLVSAPDFVTFQQIMNSVIQGYDVNTLRLLFSHIKGIN